MAFEKLFVKRKTKSFLFKVLFRFAIVSVGYWIISKPLAPQPNKWPRDANGIVDAILGSTVKGEAGQILQAKVIGAPPDFMDRRFYNWKENQNTYMIPRVFPSEKQASAEYKMFDILKKLGESKKMGMFVFNGFKLREIAKWSSKEKCDEILIMEGDNDPQVQVTNAFDTATDESDFIIFHHTVGLLSMEVKTMNEANGNVSHLVRLAEQQLTHSQNILMKLALIERNDVTAGKMLLENFYKKIVAFPTTPKSTIFSTASEYVRNSGTLLLFADDVNDLQSFGNWWSKNIEANIDRPTTDHKFITQGSVFKAYESALSYMTLLRHLTPMTDVFDVKQLHQMLSSYKFHGGQMTPPQLFPVNDFPYLYNWLLGITVDIDRAEDFHYDNDVEDIKTTFMNKHKVRDIQELVAESGMNLLNQILKYQSFLTGEELSVVDEVVASLFDETFFVFFQPLLNYFMGMRQLSNENQINDRSILQSLQQQDAFSFTKMETLLELNKLGQHLHKTKFMIGDSPTEIDQLLYESMTCKARSDYSRFPMVMNSEQLAVFEGPTKQLIIGPPGSGKTELLKFKAKELEAKIQECNLLQRILFIVGNGSPDTKFQDSLLFRRIKFFFKQKPSVVDVIAISLEEEHKETLETVKEDLRNRISSGKYAHVFIDEYWIGSKPKEHEIILELIKGIKGYVWITSVFDYNKQRMEVEKKMQIRTKPLLDTLKEVGGQVSYIYQVARGTNHIVQLEQGYSKLYQSRSYPYGTEQIYGHSLQGFPVKWVVEETVDMMYTRCVDFVTIATKQFIQLNRTSNEEDHKLTVSQADILIVDFAIRTSESWEIITKSYNKSLCDRLKDKRIQVLDFDSSDDIGECVDKVSLLSSISRDASSYLDGTEWPVVIVILPSGLVRGDVSIAESKGAQELRNYDPYISFFRSMVQLIVISDKWTSSESFLADVEYKLSKKK